jgi:hypothetical protein
VNTELFALFATGRNLLQQGSCPAVRPVIKQIVSLMTVPLVQGALRYAYKNGAAANGASAKNAAEGATFAAAVLPLVHYCNTASSAVVDANLKFGLFPDGGIVDPTRYANFSAVKSAFEDVYACLGITCAQVGGLLDGAAPYPGAEACTFQSAPIAGYVPGSNVYQHNRIDLDQKAMEDALKPTPNFTLANDWYSNGGNSESKGKYRAPACRKLPPRPRHSARPRPHGMRGLGPGPPPPRPHPPGALFPGCLVRPACAYVGTAAVSPGCHGRPHLARP